MLPHFVSSTDQIPEKRDVPRHIAIIMDGNGRWAKKRLLPRVSGHSAGIEAVREILRSCIECGVQYLTLFAFSSENWRRPVEEVSFLMELFLDSIRREATKLDQNQIRLMVIGDRSRFNAALQQEITRAEQLTSSHSRLILSIAANYGGRWDIRQAVTRMLQEHPDSIQGFEDADLSPYLSMSYAPEPDLFIRTGGEQRISNFLLWQMAYSELYFTETLWPDFDRQAFEQALQSYGTRERRFGRTSDQVQGD